jgi:murein DD-endopeptidase MepM/ murein hydrolase activator NlpD
MKPAPLKARRIFISLRTQLLVYKVRFKLWIRTVRTRRRVNRCRPGAHKLHWKKTLNQKSIRVLPVNMKTIFRLVRIGSCCLGIVAVISLFPCSYTFFPEEKPYFGDFSWSPTNHVRLSAGDFYENGRGGLEHSIPKLRLIEYTIEKGDTLWSIARDFDVDPDSIISSNVFSNVHRIHEGERLLVPNIRGIFVNIKEGDTIFELSTKYEIPPDFIMEVNDLRSNTLAPGMKIFLPGVRYDTMERAYALGEAFDKPIRGRLTSRFGYRRDPFTGNRAFHTGIDIANRYGTKVHAAREGKVIFIGIRFGYGLTVIIQHSFGYRTLYGHLSSLQVKRGQHVRKGEIIGFIGVSGRTTGPHLHFEVWHNNRLINPLTQTNMTVR